MATLCRLQEIILNAAVPYANLLLSPSINLSCIIFFLRWTGHLKKNKKWRRQKRERPQWFEIWAAYIKLSVDHSIMRSIQRAEGVSCEALILRVSGFGISLALFWLRYIQQMTVLLVQTTVNMLLKSAVAFFFFSPISFWESWNVFNFQHLAYWTLKICSLSPYCWECAKTCSYHRKQQGEKRGQHCKDRSLVVALLFAMSTRCLWADTDAFILLVGWTHGRCQPRSGQRTTPCMYRW